MNSELPFHCPGCGRPLTAGADDHVCAVDRVEVMLAGKDPRVAALFDQLWSLVRELGPAQMIAHEHRVVFRGRARFAEVVFRNRWIDGVLWLDHRCDNPRFRMVESVASRIFGHHFRLLDSRDIDDDLRELVGEAYSRGVRRGPRSDAAEV